MTDNEELGYFSGQTTHGADIALSPNLRRCTSWYIELEDLTRKKPGEEATVRGVLTTRKVGEEATVRNIC